MCPLGYVMLETPAAVNGRPGARWISMTSRTTRFTAFEPSSGRVVRRDHVVGAGKQRDEVAEHERTGWRAVQQEHDWRGRLAGFAVEDTAAVHLGEMVPRARQQRRRAWGRLSLNGFLWIGHAVQSSIGLPTISRSSNDQLSC